MWLLQGLVVVWVLQLVVFALGVSRFSKLSPPPPGQAAKADHAAEDVAISKIGREAPASESAT